jgi:hypothetical protein
VALKVAQGGRQRAETYANIPPPHTQKNTHKNYLRPKLGGERGAHLEAWRGVEVAQVQVPAADIDVRVAACFCVCFWRACFCR